MKQRAFYLQLYFGTRFYQLGLLVVAFFIFTWLMDWPLLYAKLFTAFFVLISLFDIAYLFFYKHRFTCTRVLSSRLSNSDQNPVILMLWHAFPLPLHLTLIEELPEQFQARSNEFTGVYSRNKKHSIQYFIRPVTRGDYHFGHTVCLLRSPLGIMQRRILGSDEVTVKVYPSYLQLRKHALNAQTVQVKEVGSRQLRKIGHSLEFDHIKEYVQGDDIRAVNWKATARHAGLKVNSFVDERSQQVYCVIDKGRLMKMPFNGLALMDYAINSSLVLGSVALHRQDRIGMITFSHKVGDLVVADRKPGQIKLLQDALYRIQTDYWESDYEKLYLQVRQQVKQRSLLILFTNFESTSGMRRQLPYLRQIAKHHLLLVVFFENTELAALSNETADSLEGIYTNTVAGKYVFEKKMMVKELLHHGIMALLTPPEQLTVQTVNKYVELKSRQAI
ncbi:MAG TPA: DUF58 domain-containing protein [Phnomibacter sp.]|nr:DUF58 domain-containing protein [Phnomibacter sp.]